MSIFGGSDIHYFLFLFLAKKKENHIKKPLNAFMLYMKEMRPVVQQECTLKESAAINQILGRRVSQFHGIFELYIQCDQKVSALSSQKRTV